jgi:hypothetical protein
MFYMASNLNKTRTKAQGVLIVSGETISIKDVVVHDDIIVDGRPPKKSGDRQAIREWWHEILRTHGRYSAYAILLALPSDKEAIRYFTEFGDELDLISGANCLVIALSKTDFKISGLSLGKKDLALAIDEQVSEGYSLRIAEIFGVSITEFPCLVIFTDIRSPEHVNVSLQDMMAEEITTKVRAVFSVLQKATKKNQSPLKALENQRNSKAFSDKGKSVIGGLQSVAEKTFEVAMEAWIKTVIK